MKKGYFIESILFLLGGAVLLSAALLTDSALDSLLFGFASGAICVGITGICKYFYWNMPQNKARYQEKMENEKIEMHDELKVKLRDKSGRYAYSLGLLVISISIIAFSISGKLGIVDNARTFVLFLSAYLVFQIAIGIVIFRHLLKKY